jgi:hypothetical protein
MKMIANKIIVVSLIFTIAYIIYMFFGKKPLFYPYFWRTFYYVLIFGLPFTLHIICYPLRSGTFITLCFWVFIIFFGEFIVFNLMLANMDYIKFKEYINKKVFILIFSMSIGIMLSIVYLIKNWEKIQLFFKS